MFYGAPAAPILTATCPEPPPLIRCHESTPPKALRKGKNTFSCSASETSVIAHAHSAWRNFPVLTFTQSWAPVSSLSRCLDKRTLCLRCQDVFAKTMENDVALVLIFTGQGFKVEAKKMESWLFWGLKVFHSWQPVSLTAASKKGKYGFFGLHLQDRKANCDKLSIPKKMIPKLCFSPGPVQINRLWFTQWGVLFFIVLDFFLGWKKEKRTVFFSH